MYTKSVNKCGGEFPGPGQSRGTLLCCGSCVYVLSVEIFVYNYDYAYGYTIMLVSYASMHASECYDLMHSQTSASEFRKYEVIYVSLNFCWLVT